MTSPVAPGTSPTGFRWATCDERIYFVAASDVAVHELGWNEPSGAACLSDIFPAQVTPPPPPPSTTIVPKRRRGHVHVRITIRWRWTGAHTRLRQLRLSRLPRGAVVTVACRGRGCPRRAVTARARRLPRLLKTVDGSVFRAGDRVFITISAPHLISERAVARIRYGRKPRAKLL